eukprot:5259439-Karenia_brevis.AAC.1
MRALCMQSLVPAMHRQHPLSMDAMVSPVVRSASAQRLLVRRVGSAEGASHASPELFEIDAESGDCHAPPELFGAKAAQCST